MAERRKPTHQKKKLFSARPSHSVSVCLHLFFRRFSGEKHCGFLHKSREVSLHPERRFGRRWATRRIV